MKVRHGRFGPFLGCLNYPDCKGIINIPKKDEELYTPSPCPALECTGQLLKRTSRFGKPFYSCSTYPDCDVIGNSPEEINEKYQNHTRTPYVKKPSTRKGRAKPKADAASDKPVKKTTKPKKAAPKKTTKTVKKSSEKSKKE